MRKLQLGFIVTSGISLIISYILFPWCVCTLGLAVTCLLTIFSFLPMPRYSRLLLLFISAILIAGIWGAIGMGYYFLDGPLTLFEPMQSIFPRVESLQS